MTTSCLPALPSFSCARQGGDGEHIVPGARWPAGRAAPHGMDWPGHGFLEESRALEQGEAPESPTAAPRIRGCLQVSVASAASAGRAVTAPKQQPLTHEVLRAQSRKQRHSTHSTAHPALPELLS